MRFQRRIKMTTTQDVKLLPCNKEAENAVIASCLIDPDVYPNVRAIVGPDDFHYEQPKECFTAIEKLWPGVDQLTVLAEVKHKVNPLYLSQIVSELPTSIHAEYYAKIILGESYRRKLIQAAADIAKIAYSGIGDSEGLFLEAQDIIYKTEPHSSDDILDGKGIANTVMSMISNRLEKKESISIPFGFLDIDRLTAGGMYPGNMIIIGARPGVGKSQLLIEIGYKARIRNKSVMVASAEMTIDQWCEREIAMVTGISIEEQRKGDAMNSDPVDEYVDTISKHQHYWLKDPITLSRIINKARALKNSKGLDLLIVDYIQLISDTVGKEHGGNVREKVGYISRSLKRLAKELDIPILLAAQLNRELEHRTSKVPLMSDIKEAGDIEQDADIIILLHRPSLYDPQDEAGVTRLYVPKIRQIGKTDFVRLVWNGEFHKHEDYYAH